MTFAGQGSFPFADDDPPIAEPATVEIETTSRSQRITQSTRISDLGGEVGRSRYHGNQKRGKPTNAEMADADLVEAIKTLTTARIQLAQVYRTTYAKPSLFREAEMSAAAHVNLATRFLDDVLDRIRYDERIAKLSTGKR